QAVIDLEALALDIGDDRELHAERVGGIGRRRRFLIRGSDELLAILETANLGLDLDRLALAHHLYGNLLADRRVGDDARQVFHIADGLAVEFDNDVARL